MIRILALILVATLAVLGLFKSLNSVGNRAAEETYFRHANRIAKQVRTYLAEDNYALACAELNYATRNERLALYSLSSEGTVFCPPASENGTSKDWYQTKKKDGVFDLTSQIQLGENHVEPLIYFQDQVGKYKFVLGGVRATMQTKDGMKYDTYRISFLNSLIAMALFGLFYAFLTTRKHLIGFRSNLEIADRKKLGFRKRILYWASSVFEDKELSAVTDSFVAIIQHNRRVTEMLSIASTSLNETIRDRILSDNRIQLPYRVHGWVAIPDVSGYSSTDPITKAEITKFLKNEGIEILIRYNGALQAISGDDVAATFVDYADKHLLALSFVRDLMSTLSRTGIESNGNKKSFTMKAGLAASEIKFEMGRDGFGTSGEAFTPSKRLGDSVPETDKQKSNWLVILKKDFELLSPLLGPVIREQSLELKGLGKHEVMYFNSFKAIEDLSLDQLDLIRYFRQDSDLIEILKMLSKIPNDKALELGRKLRNFETRNVQPEVIKQVLETLSKFSNITKGSKDGLVLSELVWVIKSFVSNQQWNPELTEAYLNLPSDVDARLNANIIDVLVQRAPTLEVVSRLTDRFVRDRRALISDRVRFSLLAAKMIVDLKSAHLDELRRALGSDSLNIRKSAVYCAYVVFSYYRKNRPGYIELRPGYGKLILALRRIKATTMDQRMQRYYEEAAMSEPLAKNTENQGLENLDL